jgi:hypothetical protein
MLRQSSRYVPRSRNDDAPRETLAQKERREAAEVKATASRRTIRKRLAKKHDAKWIGGILYRHGRPVPGVEPMPKDGMPAIGMKAQEERIATPSWNSRHDGGSYLSRANPHSSGLRGGRYGGGRDFDDFD